MRLYNETLTETSREVFRELRGVMILLGIVDNFAPYRGLTIKYCMKFGIQDEVQ